MGRSTLVLELVELRRPSEDERYSWSPFEPNDAFTSRWWDPAPYWVDDPRFVQVLHNGSEVARLRLDDDFPGSQHIGAPRLGPEALEIQFFEVAATHRRRGVGSQTVTQLAELHQDCRLLAMSEDADEFWQSLGWDRYDFDWLRPLFVAPASWPPRSAT